VITLKTQPDRFLSNFRPVGASRGVLNISERVEASWRQSDDVNIAFDVILTKLKNVRGYLPGDTTVHSYTT